MMAIPLRKNHLISTTVACMTYNQPKLVEALYDTLHPYLEVIDNGSALPIPHTTLRVPENRYFSGGWNYAMPSYTTTWVAMLNDDIEWLTIPMIEALVDEAETHGYAAISPVFNSPHTHMRPQGKGLRQVSSIDWIATLVRKEAWDDVGGFDSENFPGYGCDLDIAYRLKLKCYRLAVDDRQVITHLGGTAAIAGGTQHIQGNVTRMNEAFQRKYHCPDWATFTTEYLL